MSIFKSSYIQNKGEVKPISLIHNKHGEYTIVRLPKELMEEIDQLIKPMFVATEAEPNLSRKL